MDFSGISAGFRKATEAAKRQNKTKKVPYTCLPGHVWKATKMYILGRIDGEAHA